MGKQIISLILFLAIGLGSIGLVMTPVMLRLPNGDGSFGGTMPFVTYKPSLLTPGGAKLYVEAWKMFPNYNIGLIGIALVAFGGAGLTLYSVRQLIKEADSED